VEELTPIRRAGELAMLMLRLASGIDYADFTARTGLDARTVYAEQIERFGRVGLLIAGSSAICLTETGLNVADAVAAEFLSPA
jgi:coproporphyrinogen III oxidase-like Fe-S oxidoreductase